MLFRIGFVLCTKPSYFNVADATRIEVGMPLKNYQHDAIMRIYEKNRRENRYENERRYRQVTAMVPAYKKVEEEISTLSMHHAKSMLLDGNSDMDTYKQQLQQLKQRKQELLTTNGFPSDYLTPVYTCRDCKDTGYTENGKCHCFRKAEIEMLYMQSNIKEILETENFKNFSFDYYSPAPAGKEPSPLENAKQAYQECKKFTKDFGTQMQNLLLLGSVGVGKTFLSNCIAKDLIDNGFSVIYFSSHDLFDLLAKQAFSKSEDREQTSFLEHIFDCDLLIIDDLGTELNNSLVTSQLFLCINERLLRNKSTLISTNLSVRDLSTLYSERIFSRITGNYRIIRLTGEDIRLQKRRRKT